ncbi:GNAT family N-acetyltransferase [Salinadaptatus halalkaliphilus]|uniref:GNAT family N-acetyltransferase n=1 Tax=Salinadaptatus halalkaliphilus TaxID=2419781 RepID=UPI001FE328B5|nr:GNAT family N-acetyltransferase [Salinadaptatus halalkaliphilus]
MDRWLEELRADAEGVLVALENGSVRGFADFRWEDTPTKAFVDPDEAELKAIYVDPDSWGQGLGTALLEAGLERLPDEIERLRLEVLADNDIGTRFYSGRGVHARGRRLIDALRAGFILFGLESVLAVEGHPRTIGEIVGLRTALAVVGRRQSLVDYVGDQQSDEQRRRQEPVAGPKEDRKGEVGQSDREQGFAPDSRASGSSARYEFPASIGAARANATRWNPVVESPNRACSGQSRRVITSVNSDRNATG